jgi:hypothetical protein
MRIAGSICLALGLIALFSAMSPEVQDEPLEGAEAVGYAVGSYALPLLLLVSAAVLLAKASRRKRETGRGAGS